MSNGLKFWKEAATLIISTSKFSNRFLLMKRSVNSKFMPNAHVFPGGITHKADFDSSHWQKVFEKAGYTAINEVAKELHVAESRPPMITRHRHADCLPSDVALRICALRETFEEAGVLLARPADQVQKMNMAKGRLNLSSAVDDIHLAAIISDWRERVDSDAYEFANMFLELNLVPDVWSLFEWSDWLTPITFSRRYDTLFYVCCIDHIPRVAHCARETSEAAWMSTAEALSRYQNEEIWLAPPQLYEFCRLQHFNTSELLLEHAAKREAQGTSRWLSVRIGCEDGDLWLVPGDSLYPQQPDESGEGEDQPSTHSTLLQARDSTRHHNRFELYGPYNVVVSCNIAPDCGHVPITPPITQPLDRSKY